MASKLTVLFLYLSLLIHFTFAVPQRGVKEMVFDATNQYRSFAKSLFKDATITITDGPSALNMNTGTVVKNDDGTKSKPKKVPDFSLKWYLYQSNCGQYFLGMKDEVLPALTGQGQSGHPMYTEYSNGLIEFTDKHAEKEIYLERDILNKDGTKTPTPSASVTKPKNKITTVNPQDEQPPADLAPRQKRDSPGSSGSKLPVPKAKPKPKKKQPKKSTTPAQQATTLAAKRAGLDGNYLLVISSEDDLPVKGISIQVKVSIKMSTGYLSAADWPLLPFYGAMSLVYLAYGVVWLIVSACQWRELLRIQFWIGGVIALGMLEKAVLFSEYNNANDTGVPAHGLVMLSLVLSCIKRTLSRILIIIVSMGFGIVKPRLGAALHRVLGVGCLYFILCAVEGSYREYSVKGDVNRKQVIASVPLSVLDAVICWWIFMSLLQTMRTLRIRKNLVKLSLYRHFTNILVVSVIASVAFMVWAIKARNLNSCIKDWKEMWIDDAFWHFLFALILLAIMVLWRPTANNQRYAFTPLIDVGEDDDDDMTLSDAFQGMKMRNKGDAEAPSRSEKQRKKVEDDLKWVEENIPTSGGIDTALPTLLDSDEEMMTTKLEMSKME